MKNSSQSQYRPDIDGMRAIAALAVVGFHAFPSMVRGGFVGVDIFFVISGFLLTGIILRNLEAGCFSFWDFYSRRILRIFPALAVVLGAVFFVGWHVMSTSEFDSLGKHIAGGVAFISNILYWRESGYFELGAGAKPLLHLWSLGVEEQFYIVFPLLLFVFYNKKLSVPKAITLFLVVSFLVNILVYKKFPDMDFYSPITRFWEFLSGSLLAVAGLRYAEYGKALASRLEIAVRHRFPFVSKHEDTRFVLAVLAFLGLVFIFASIFAFKTGKRFPGFKAVLPVAGTVLLIMAGPQNSISRVLLGNRIAVGIGLISYPLYLWHWPILSFAEILQGESNSKELWLAIRLACIALTFLLATLTYKYIEIPIRFGFGKKTESRRACALLVLLFFIGSAGLTVRIFDGVPQRAAARDLAQFDSMIAFPEYQSGEGLQYALELVPEVSKSDYPEDVSFVKACIVPESEKTVAILGDSHAWAAYPGIAQRNKERAISTILVAESALWSPLIGDDQHQGEALQEAINKKSELWLDYLASTQNIKQVYIFTSAAYATRSKNYPQSMQQAIDRINKYEKKVFVVADVPILPVHIKNLYPRPFSLCVQNATQPDSKSSARQGQSAYLARLQKLTDAVIVEGSIDAFCPQDTCMAFSPSGVPLYLDRDHLSPYGSSFLVDTVLEEYLQLMER